MFEEVQSIRLNASVEKNSRLTGIGITSSLCTTTLIASTSCIVWCITRIGLQGRM